MRCKFCNAEMEDDRLYCPECGKRQDSQKPSDLEQEKQKNTTKAAKKDKKMNWSLIAGVAIGLLIAALVVVLIVLGGKGADKTPETTAATEPVSEYAQYAGVVVAKIGDQELTNDMLQVLYMNMVGTFYQDYGSALSYFGLDLTKPLSEQEYPYQNENEPSVKTWEDYFRELAVERWKNYVAALALAEKDGFKITDARLKEIDNEIAELEDMAKQNSYADVDAMVKYSYGDCCSIDTYKAYMVLDTTVRDYYASIYGVEITDEQLEECFQKNKDDLAEDGITKESGFASSVRHILIAPEGGTKDAQGNTTYSDEEWAACEKEAQAVLDEWKKGEATEDSFAALVSKYTDDGGSASTGGLYEDVRRDSNYVEAFRDWAIDAKRKAGDTDLVKTPFGYHIMYFVSGEAEWISFARDLVQTERMEALDARIVAFHEENPIELFLDKLKLQNTYAR